MEVLELSAARRANQPFLQRVSSQSGVDFSRCYQCGKCSAGCPVAFAMDVPPNRVIRLLQLGQKEAVLKSHSPWLCAACETCYTRCPREVDLPRLMETLRQEAARAGYVAEREVALFNDLFLESVAANGRLHELGMILRFNLRSGHWLKDAGLAPALLRNGKLNLRAERVGQGAIQRIFERVKALGGEPQ